MSEQPRTQLTSLADHLEYMSLRLRRAADEIDEVRAGLSNDVDEISRQGINVMQVVSQLFHNLSMPVVAKRVIQIRQLGPHAVLTKGPGHEPKGRANNERK